MIFTIKKIISLQILILFIAITTSADCLPIYNKQLARLNPNSGLAIAGTSAIFLFSPVAWAGVFIGLSDHKKAVTKQQELGAAVALIQEAESTPGTGHDELVKTLASKGLTITRDDLQFLLIKANAENYLCDEGTEGMRVSTLVEKIIDGSLINGPAPKLGSFVYINHYLAMKGFDTLSDGRSKPTGIIMGEFFSDRSVERYGNLLKADGAYGLIQGDSNYRFYQSKTIQDVTIQVTSPDDQAFCAGLCVIENDREKSRLVFSFGQNQGSALEKLNQICDQPGEDPKPFRRFNIKPSAKNMNYWRINEKDCLTLKGN